ncbi:MAG: ABC transporter permease, partial [Acidimicrobiales bacterium]|nr:ABC transporter permease [Acidimicrobiales bacterium]
MWKISARDLQFRLRRFLIAIAVTGLVFAIAVAIDGIKQTIGSEPASLVRSFSADVWVVPEGSTGVFTTTALLPAGVVDELRATPGVVSAEPVVAAYTTITGDERRNANVIGFDLDAGSHRLTEGRAARAIDEAVIGGGLDLDLGERLDTTSGSFTVVGRLDGLRYNGGTPTVVLSVEGAQRALLGGLDVVMGVAVQGTPATLPVGSATTTNELAIADLRLTLESASSTIDFVAFLTWLIAAGVIGAIVYLTAIERSRDFAVLRATGSPNRLIVGGLMIQSLFVSVVSAAIAVPIASVLRAGMPMPVTLSGGSVVRIILVGIVVGVIASLAAVRRALTTDPALA